MRYNHLFLPLRIMTIKSLNENKQTSHECSSVLIDSSIIIVNYNTCDLLSNCLDSILAYANDISLEVIVVDNGSTDKSTHIVKKGYPMVNLVENKENLGFAKANNQGIKICRGRYIILLNSDTLVTSSFRRLLIYMADHPDIGLASPKTLNVEGTIQPSAGRDIKPYHYFLKILNLYNSHLPLLGRDRIRNIDYDTITEVETISGSAMVICREVFETVGMLDENFFFYNEEMDFCRRARKKGWRIFYLPLAEVVHFRAESTKDSAISEVLQIASYKSDLYFFSKYFSKITYAFLKYIYRLTFIGKIVLLSCKMLSKRGNTESCRGKILLRWRMLKI